jgi:hypothetical protein
VFEGVGFIQRGVYSMLYSNGFSKHFHNLKWCADTYQPLSVRCLFSPKEKVFI